MVNKTLIQIEVPLKYKLTKMRELGENFNVYNDVVKFLYNFYNKYGEKQK